jgi:hypothetical protein
MNSLDNAAFTAINESSAVRTAEFSHWNYINRNMPGKALHDKQQSEEKGRPSFIHFSMWC